MFPVLKTDDIDDSIIDGEVKEDEGKQMRFKSARDGDESMCPFQCDVCHFHDIHHRGPIYGNPCDQ